MNIETQKPNEGHTIMKAERSQESDNKELFFKMEEYYQSNPNAPFEQNAIEHKIDRTMGMLKKRCVSAGMCSSQDFDQAALTAETVEKLSRKPTSPSDFVNLYAFKHQLKSDYQNVITAGNTDQATPVFSLGADKVLRELRLMRSALKLTFQNHEIDDAFSKWLDEQAQDRLEAIISTVRYEPEVTDKADEYWKIVHRQFDSFEHSPVYVTSLLKKFIWQVKRKMVGLPVDNHLMVVLTGPQGKGKSTFVRDFLLAPVAELVCVADFKMIEESRQTGQWRNYVFFMDEMGYAVKSDMENIKNKITANYVTGRPMRTNLSVHYKQNGTFIGCSNKELDQLIKDETGNRRFAGLSYSHEPDWNALNTIDCLALWKSVDENAEDPVIPVLHELQISQMAVRTQSYVEQWLNEYTVPHDFLNRQVRPSQLFGDFKDWVDDYAPTRSMDLATFTAEFGRLIKNGAAPGWNQTRANKKIIMTYARPVEGLDAFLD